MRNINKIKKWIESVMPMTFGSLIVLLIIIYLIFIVSKTVWGNYQSNQQISNQRQELAVLEEELDYMQNEIIYLNTYSFREKQARSKLAYVAPGETAVSVPLDPTKVQRSGVANEGGEPDLDVPNYFLWLDYFTK